MLVAMSTLSIGTNSPYVSAVLAQQQVQGDQAQVQSDQALLSQDQMQLNKDSARATTGQQQSQGIQQNQGIQAQQADLGRLGQKAQAVQQALLQHVQSPQATVNTSGQTVGKIIHVVA